MRNSFLVQIVEFLVFNSNYLKEFEPPDAEKVDLFLNKYEAFSRNIVWVLGKLC